MLPVFVAIPQVQLLDKVVCLDPQWRCRSCSSSSRSSTSLSVRRDSFPWSPFSETIEILLLQYIDKVVHVGCASPASSLVQSVRRQCDPTVAASMLDTVVHMPVVVQRQVLGLVETVQNLWEFRSWHCLLDRLMTCPLACRLFRVVCTGTRPGLTPAIRAGKGWRGRWELAPRCPATQLAARRHDPGQTRRVLNHLNHTYQTQNPHTTRPPNTKSQNTHQTHDPHTHTNARQVFLSCELPKLARCSAIMTTTMSAAQAPVVTSGEFRFGGGCWRPLCFYQHSGRPVERPSGQQNGASCRLSREWSTVGPCL